MSTRYAGNTTVKLVKPGRSKFDLSHEKPVTMRPGKLTPVLCVECVPSDTFNGSTEILVRLAPLLAPVYAQLTLFVHFFFVPCRLIWAEWETFITGGRLGVGVDPAEAPIPPYLSIAQMCDDGEGDPDILLFLEKGSVMDHMGCPLWLELATRETWAATVPNYANSSVDFMPFGAYGMVWYEYYRDRNFLADSLMEFPVPSGRIDVVNPVSTPTSWRSLTLHSRAYEQDYFTSALPFTQRGTEVLIPMAGTGTVNYLQVSRVLDQDGDPADANSLVGTVLGNGDLIVNKLNAAGVGAQGRIENIDDVNFENSTIGINDFRSAYALQVWLERNAIAGSRYNESIQAHFGVRPQDSRLQRPEYIGGGRMPIKISEIVSTAYSSDGEAVVPLANLAGHGITYGNTNRFSYFCTEHGYIIGIASIMATPLYHQGIPRMFHRRTFLDWIWPTFAKLGEQQVDKAELYASPTNMAVGADGQRPLFGYQSRYADWKQINGRVAGDFHGTLLFWTSARDFSASPTLGDGFVRFDAATVDRMFAVQESNVDKFWCYVNNHLYVTRPLPYFGTPNTLGFV